MNSMSQESWFWWWLHHSPCSSSNQAAIYSPNHSQAANCPLGPTQVVSCVSGDEQFQDQPTSLIQLVTNLTLQMALLTKKVDSTLNAETFTPPSKAIELKVPDFLMALPVQDDESFCHLNDNLNDSINRQLMIQFLAGIGGKDARSTTTNLLRRILLDEVAEQYSLTGKQMKNSKKKSFLATNVCKVLFHMCKKNVGTTEAKFNEITGDWLNQAKIRIMRRAERRKKLAPTSIEKTN